MGYANDESLSENYNKQDELILELEAIAEDIEDCLDDCENDNHGLFDDNPRHPIHCLLESSRRRLPQSLQSLYICKEYLSLIFGGSFKFIPLTGPRNTY